MELRFSFVVISFFLIIESIGLVAGLTTWKEFIFFSIFWTTLRVFYEFWRAFWGGNLRKFQKDMAHLCSLIWFCCKGQKQKHAIKIVSATKLTSAMDTAGSSTLEELKKSTNEIEDETTRRRRILVEYAKNL